MTITPRQTYRLLRRYRDGGASAIANQRPGRPSNNRLPDVVRDHAIALVRELYADFGPTFAAEKLAERHDLKVSRETLRKNPGRARPRSAHSRLQSHHSNAPIKPVSQSILSKIIALLTAIMLHTLGSNRIPAGPVACFSVRWRESWHRYCFENGRTF